MCVGPWGATRMLQRHSLPSEAAQTAQVERMEHTTSASIPLPLSKRTLFTYSANAIHPLYVHDVCRCRRRGIWADPGGPVVPVATVHRTPLPRRGYRQVPAACTRLPQWCLCCPGLEVSGGPVCRNCPALPCSVGADCHWLHDMSRPPPVQPTHVYRSDTLAAKDGPEGALATQSRVLQCCTVAPPGR